MSKSKSIYCFLILVLLAGTVFSGFAQSIGPVPVLPALKLAVTQSPLTIYPPIMIYTAQLSFIPSVTTTALKVEFYNTSADSISTRPVLIGTALIDKSGKAVLSKQMKPGAYIAIAKIVINNCVVWSDKVEYKVP